MVYGDVGYQGLEKREEMADERWTVRLGSTAIDLKMQKGQYTVGGAGQGSCQSQSGTPTPCAQATVWIPENQAPGSVENHGKMIGLATLTNLRNL